MSDDMEFDSWISLRRFTTTTVVLSIFFVGYFFGQYNKADARKEQFGICRRAIERKFTLPEDQARALLEYERKWEDR